MARVTLPVGGFSYEIVCREGEQAHFERIAAILDAKATDAARAVGGLTEARMLLFAGLLLADETASLRAAVAMPPPPTPPPPTPNIDPVFADAVAALAERIERLADTLDTDLEAAPPTS